MSENFNNTELGVIRTLANVEEYTRKAEKMLIDNMFMPLKEEENKKVFLESGKRIVTAKEDIQEIKERKIQELINKNKLTVEICTTNKLNKIFARLEEKTKVVSYWVEVIKTSENTCKIIDKYTKIELLETTMPIVDRIIKATFEVQ